MRKDLQPEGWMKPKGYSNGVQVEGQHMVFTGGLIGWDGNCEFQAKDFVGQLKQTLENVRAVLAEADCGPEHLVRMTWYITDKQVYNGNLKEIGKVYREVIGRHFPPMAVVQVAGLMEDEALVEIEATAVR